MRATAETLDTPRCASASRTSACSIPAAPERSPEFLAKLVLSELDKWGPPIKAAGVSADVNMRRSRVRARRASSIRDHARPEQRR